MIMIEGEVMEGTRKRFDSLTGLRGIFILMIVFYHMGGYFDAPFASVLRLPYKWGGVMGNSFFFMLSGFVISCGYRDRILGRQVDFGGFIKKRLIRIYPMYLVTDILQACFLVYEQGMIINFKNIVSNIFMVTTGWVDDIYPYNISSWFVSVLLLCHIIYYVLCRAARENPKLVLYLEIGLVLWGYLLLSKGWDVPFCYAHDGEGMLNFFVGCILFEIYEKNSARGNRRLLGGLLCLAAGFLFLSHQVGFEQFSGDSRLPFAFLICPAAVLAALELRWIGKILESRPFMKLGQISMNIFFWHMPMIVLVNLLGMKGWLGGTGARVRFLGTLLVILLWAAGVESIEGRLEKGYHEAKEKEE